MMLVKVIDALSEATIGRSRATTSRVRPMTRPRFRTSQTLRSASGIGRHACTAAQLPFSSSRPACWRWRNSAPRMTRNSTTSTNPPRG